jgi:hypothetical protein
VRAACDAATDEARHKETKAAVKRTSRRAQPVEDGVARVAIPTEELLRRLRLQRFSRLRIRGQRTLLALQADISAPAVAAAAGRARLSKAEHRRLKQLHRHLRQPGTSRRVARDRRTALQSAAAPEPQLEQPDAAAAAGHDSYFGFSTVRGKRAAPFRWEDLERFDPIAAAALPYRAAHHFSLLPTDVICAADAPDAEKVARKALRALTRRRRCVVPSGTITRFRRQAVLGPRVVDGDCAFFTIDAAVPATSVSESSSGSEDESSAHDADDDASASEQMPPRVSNQRKQVCDGHRDVAVVVLRQL